MMREPRPKARIREYFPLPDDLLQFLRYVYEQIKLGEEAATIPSGELLHFKRAYGGLIEEGGDYFRFTYLPEPDFRGAWYFTLHSSTIEMIAEGGLNELRLWACQSPDCRCKFSSKRELCARCDFEDVQK